MAKHEARKERRRQALLVLGMHRSGTSAISGLLALLGAQAPRSLMPPTKDNPRGYWESVEVMKANDRVLSSAGSRWNDWGQFNPAWYDSLVADELRDSLGELVKEEFGTAPLLLIKDPRISRFLPLWLDTLRASGIDARIVVPVRHPLAVARSLQVRDNFGRNLSLLLWLRHVLDAEASSRQLPRTFVPYESVLADWQSAARRIATELDIVWPGWSGDTELKIGEFLTSELRHHREGEEEIAGDSELVEWVRQTHAALLQASHAPLEQASLDNLDRIRREFNRSSAIYAPVVREHQMRVEALYADMKAKLAQSVEKCQVQADQLAEAEQRREAAILKASQYAEEQSKVQQQKMMDEQLALQAAGFKQAMELAAAEYAARLAEQQEQRARTEQEHREVADRLRASEAERAECTTRLAELQEQRARAEQEHREVADHLRASQAECAEHSRRLVEKEQEHRDALHDLQERLAGREETVASLSEEVTQLKSSMETQSLELHRALSAAETSAKIRFRETAKLTELLFSEQKHATRAAELARTLSETESRNKRQVALLEYRNAFTNSTLSRRSEAWQHQAQTCAQALNRIGSSRALSAIARARGIPIPAVHEPDLDASVDLQVEMLRASELFDASWYLEKYPDAAESGMEPERHYLLVGAAAGYNPGPAFDSVAYLMEYPDVREAGVDPLVHYLEFGQAESRVRTAPAEMLG